MGRCLLIPLAVALLPHAALAIGMYEGGGTRYALTAAAADTGLLAFDVEMDWCELNNDGGEKSGVIKAVLVTDLKMNNRTWFFSPKNGHERRNAPARARPMNQWDAYQQEKGFRPLSEVALPAAGTESCQAELVVFSRKGKIITFKEAELDVEDSFAQRTIGLRLKAGDKVLGPVRLGRHAISAGAPKLWALPLPALGAVRVYFITAHCDGPPPGYFGEDDPGTCYEKQARHYKDLTPRSLPGIDACLNR